MLQVRVTWPELVQTVIALGGNINTIKSWKRSGLPYRWRMKLMRDCGAPSLLSILATHRRWRRLERSPSPNLI